ncbi:MAG: DUF1385 domain-containing protein [Ardenticatenaceae bacterium]|nr:DUF1385 domain-containing protein [Anaerolineales bacterium]MCB8922463.1 DUF1385 domain-containing protein [Ardenticatenaceae bacterium]
MSNTNAPLKEAQPTFNYGGQAVIEGVMMRGSRALAVAVRNPENEIVVHTEPLDARIYGGRIARLPFLRGLTLLWDALGLGIKSLMFSAEVALEEDEKPTDENGEPGKVFEGPAQWGTVLFSLSFSILLFFVFPAFVAGLAERWLPATGTQIISNLIEGLVRLALLVGYIWGIGFIPDIKRLYGYHGAEHKTINAYEDGATLTPEIVAHYSLEHPRCGTAFLLTVVIFSILIYTLLPPLGIVARILSRIVLLPVIAGLGYEFLRFTAAHQDNAFIRFITKPNLALQHLTTNEPDPTMLAVAIAALQHVLAYENNQQEVADSIILAEVPASNIAS